MNTMSTVSYRSHDSEGGPDILGTSSLMHADRIHVCVAKSNEFQLRMQTGDGRNFASTTAASTKVQAASFQCRYKRLLPPPTPPQFNVEGKPVQGTCEI